MFRALSLASALASSLLVALPAVVTAQSCLDASTFVSIADGGTLRGGPSRDGGQSYVSTVTPGDNVDVYVELDTLPQHIGKRADIYALVTSGLASATATGRLSVPRQNFTIDAEGRVQPATGSDTLQPLATSVVLQQQQRWKLYSGKLNREDGFSVQLLYCVGAAAVMSNRLAFAADYTAAQSLQVDFPPLGAFSFSGKTLNFRGGVDSSVPYGHAVVEVTSAGLPTFTAQVLPGGRWNLTDVPVASAMTLTLKVHGQVVDAKTYRIERDPVWSNVEGFALDTAARTAYIADPARRQIFSVNLDTGNRTVMVGTENLVARWSGFSVDIELTDTGKLFTVSKGNVLGEMQANVPNSFVSHFITSRGIAGGLLSRLVGEDFRSVVYSKARQTLFVGDYSNGVILAYDLKTGTSRALGLLPNGLTPTTTPAGAQPLSVAGLTDLALDEANNRLLVTSLFSARIWAVDLSTGATTQVFDQATAAIVGTAPRVLNVYVPPTGATNVQFAIGYSALAYDSKRQLWLLGRGQELLGVNLQTNTVTQVASLTNAGNPVADMRDLAYDDKADRYVYVDGTLNTLYSFDPVTKQARLLSGSAASSNRVSYGSELALAPATQSQALAVNYRLSGIFSVQNFRKDEWRFRNAPLLAPLGALAFESSGTAIVRVINDPIALSSGIAYDPTRNRHIVVTQPVPVSASGALAPPLNDPMLGIRGLPSGYTNASFYSQLESRIYSVELNEGPLLEAPATELKPVYAGPAADLLGLNLVAAKADGSQYALGNASGHLFVLNPGTLALTKVPVQLAALPVAALAFAGDTLWQLDAWGELSSINLDARSADYGKRRVLPRPEVSMPAAAMAVSFTQLGAYLAQPTGVVAVDLASGARQEVTGAQRGEGDALVSPGDVVQLNDPHTLYVEDSGGVVIIDLQTGDRIGMQ
ncbi:MAG: hypothetical protein V4603_00945 [Pseudomonadota bacterium]